MKTQFLKPAITAFLLLAIFIDLRAETITGLNLINASTDQVIKNLVEVDTVDLTTFPSINIQAITDPASVGGKVYFSWTGPESGTLAEAGAPYAMKKDDSGDYRDWIPALGTYQISVYATDISATAGTTRIFKLTVVKSGGSGGGTGGGTGNILDAIKFLGGRIAFSSDGNQHDKDDFGATALSLAMISYSGLAAKFVHYDHSDHMGDNNVSQNNKMIEAAKGGAQRFGLDVTKVFDDQTEATQAVANFAAEAAKCSADNPLWYIVAGPMEMPWRCLNAAPADKRQYIHCISHSSWNEDHNDAQNYHTWADMKRDFPTVIYHDIIDQNTSNGDDDFSGPFSKWSWLQNSSNADWVWLYNRNEKTVFDVSDTGMTYWLITGGPNGGNDKGGPAETKALFENPITSGPEVKDDYVIIQAESTSSPLGLWQLIEPGNANYVTDASGNAHIEFTGNSPSIGPATSPLKYTFTIKNAGYYRMMFRARKRLAGEAADKCNDCYVRMEGDFDAPATTNVNNTPANEEQLRQDFKFYGGNANDWGWASGFDMGGDTNKRYPIYYFKAGETYTVTISGRAQRFNIDYMMWYNEAKYTMDQAKLIRPNGSGIVNPQPTACISYKAVQFPTYSGVAGFVDGYVDTAHDALAINATVVTSRDKYAAAQRTFDGETGNYKVTLTTLQEMDGESTYKVKIGDSYYGGIMKNNETSTDYTEQKHEITDSVLITKGDVIQVEYMAVTNGKVPENGGTAYSRGRWRSIDFNKAGCTNIVTIPQAPFDSIIQIPGIVEVENYDIGSQGVSYNDSEAGNKGNVYRTDGVDIGSFNESFHVGWTANGEWLEYTINVEETGLYDVAIFYAAGRTTPAKIGFEFFDEGIVLFNNFTLPITGSFNTYTTVTKKDVQLTAGNHILRLNFTISGCNIDKITFTKTAAASVMSMQMNNITVFPNPSIEGRFKLSTDIIWDVYSLQGVKVLNGKGKEIDLSRFSTGLYYLRSENAFQKLVKN